MEFQNGKIYTIRSYKTDKYYIGSTNQATLAQRLGKHRGCYKDYLKDNRNKYYSSYEVLNYEDHYIELLELYPCSSKSELHKREGELQRQFKHEIVNISIAGRTVKEYQEDNKKHIAEYAKEFYLVNKAIIAIKDKQYYEINKQSIIERHKQYNQTNKEIIAEKAKERYTCDCGSSSIIKTKTRHEQTKKHQSFITNQYYINELNI